MSEAPGNRTGKHEAELAAVQEMREHPTVGVVTAGRAFGIGRDRSYAAAAAKQLPTVRFGPELRVVSALALQMLGLAPIAETAPPQEGEP